MKTILSSIPIFCLFLSTSPVGAEDAARPAGPAAGTAPATSPTPAPTDASWAANTSSSSNLTTQAWEALARGDYAAAKAAIARCRELYESKAKEMQAGLTTLPPADQAHSCWALNDVGTCLFIAGKVAEAEGKTEEALARYREVVDQFSLAQCWDKQGWFWRPSVAAKERITALTFDSAK